MLSKLIPACLCSPYGLGRRRHRRRDRDVARQFPAGRSDAAELSLAAAASRRSTWKRSPGSRAATLITRQFDKADAYAKETEQLAVQALATRPLDAEPHLPLALGAAIEVEAQVLTANGDRSRRSGSAA